MDPGGRSSTPGRKVPPPVPKKPRNNTPRRSYHEPTYTSPYHQAPQRWSYHEAGTREARTNEDSSSEANPLLSVGREELEACEDLTRLAVLYDQAVLGCVTARYNNNTFYTWAGPTLVAANPCRPVPHLYTPALIQQHHGEVKSGCDRRLPHVYSVAGVAHHRLTHHLGSVNQAVLVSGESGAGKTESARYMLGYLSHVETHLSPPSPTRGAATHQPGDIQGRILASNPILEAFGNAATLRNHNSSRFGKLIRLQYGGRQLRGAEIDTYLLEKTRVTHQPASERNFHIFYQVLAGIRSGACERLGVRDQDQFAIAPGEVLPADLDNLALTLDAFRQLSFSPTLQKEILQVIVALLHLGNVSFTRDRDHPQAWTISRHHPEELRTVRRTCELLGLDEDKLCETLTIRTISVGTARRVSVFHKPCESEGACGERRDALMQLIYESLFASIVAFINRQVSAKRSDWSNFLGILDVYGFETFQHNSLEQLCINYANERLQQEFMLRYLATEHQVLKEEGFLDVDIPYTDNTQCVAALDSPVSVFAILNEECQLKRAVDEDAACDRVCQALGGGGVVSAPASPRKTKGFVVRHYAGPVKYDARGLLHKNKDEVPIELRSLMSSSQHEFAGNLVADSADTDPDSGRRTTRKVTTLAKFKASLDTLMRTLAQCDLHYVRCLKPNQESLPGRPDGAYLLQQLRASGIIETVCVSQAGYPLRISYGDFIVRYGQANEANPEEATGAITRAVLGATPEGNVDPAKCRLGRTRVFLSESALHTLEAVRDGKRTHAATTLQKCWRGYRCHQRYHTVRRATNSLQRGVRTFLAMRRYQRLRRAATTLQKHVRRFLAVRRLGRVVRAAVTLQKYWRGWCARRRYEATLHTALTRPYSRQSLASMHSLGYYSLTASVSGYSLNPSLHDVTAHELDTLPPLRGEALKAYLSPEHRQRILETEESGIETDTESINGDEPKSERKRSRKLRRRAQLQELLGARRTSRLFHAASDDESLLDVSGSHAYSSSGPEHASTVDGRASTKTRDTRAPEGSGAAGGDDVMPCEESLKLRVATMRKFEDVSALIRESSPLENLQMVLPKQNLSLFFKDGVLSYRRMPLVKVKFHTRHTCLPFSHHLPHHERPQGLLDALR